MTTLVYPTSHLQSERTIGIARVVLATTAILALWMDPDQSPAPAGIVPVLYSAYGFYAAALFMWSITRDTGPWWPLATHAVDLVVFALCQYLTLGPSSPFFVYFLFSVFCGAMRWGWQGTLATGTVVIVAYIGLAAPIGRSEASQRLDLNGFIIRLAYLVVATGILVQLGRYEARLRFEIERLARWPAPMGTNPETAIGRVLEYAARIMQSGCALVVWEDDEPAVHEARWAHGTTSVRQRPPDGLPLTTDTATMHSTFLCDGPVREARAILLSDNTGHLVRREGMPLTSHILEQLDGAGLASAPIRTDLISGRVFFSDLGTPPAEALPLTELVAREIAASLHQFRSARQREELAAREERVRVARDLHDGVLQALTGVRLELRALTKLTTPDDESLETRLVSIERALAMEQRELRFFIAGLEPGTGGSLERADGLSRRLDSVRERLSLEWQTPVTLRVSPQVFHVPESLQEAVPLMVHEAAVNALKHARPSRVSVDVESTDGQLRIAVTDDGHGFPFKGSFTHETLAAAHVAPRSLFDRVSALGGQLSIDSSDRGSRVEMLLTL